MKRKARKKRLIFHSAVSLGHRKSLIFYLATEDLAAKTFQLTGAARQRYEEYAGEAYSEFSQRSLARCLTCSRNSEPMR